MSRSDPELDFDDPDVEEEWCDARREEVVKYLCTEGLSHGEVGEWPAWHVAPYVSVWAIESLVKPGWVGWWVICGDLPTDYLSADSVKHPRTALRAFADRWAEVAKLGASGKEHCKIKIGSESMTPELSDILAARAETLYQLAADEECWGPEYD